MGGNLASIPSRREQGLSYSFALFLFFIMFINADDWENNTIFHKLCSCHLKMLDSISILSRLYATNQTIIQTFLFFFRRKVQTILKTYLCFGLDEKINHFASFVFLAFLITKMAAASTPDLWIGLNSLKQDGFYWTDGKKRKYTNWGYSVSTDFIHIFSMDVSSLGKFQWTDSNISLLFREIHVDKGASINDGMRYNFNDDFKRSKQCFIFFCMKEQIKLIC